MVFFTYLLYHKRHITESNNGYVPSCFCKAVFSQPQYSEVKIDDETVFTAKQIKELQKRNAQLEEENLILKKAIAIFTPNSVKD